MLSNQAHHFFNLMFFVKLIISAISTSMNEELIASLKYYLLATPYSIVKLFFVIYLFIFTVYEEIVLNLLLFY